MKFDPAEIQSAFTKNGFDYRFFDTSEEAVDSIVRLIPRGASVGFGGSETVKECGLLSAMIESREYTLLHRELVKDIPAEELYAKMHRADWYVSGANALCKNGQIVNVDGRGNRVAALLNGPKNVLIVCGVNKIVENVDDGIKRIHEVACPLNARRLNRKTPCATLNRCVDCNSPDRMCNATVIMHHPTSGTNVHVVLINKSLGY